MRKIILVLLVFALLLCASACKSIDQMGNISPDTDKQDEGSLMYMDPQIDMLLIVKSIDWVYTKELYEGAVFFHPRNKPPQLFNTGFAISSQEKWDAPIDDVWEAVKLNLSSSIQGFEWQREELVEVGDYSADRYHFWGEGIFGDYVIWETQNLLYICSLTAEQEDYQGAIDLLIESLNRLKLWMK